MMHRQRIRIERHLVRTKNDRVEYDCDVLPRQLAMTGDQMASREPTDLCIHFIVGTAALYTPKVLNDGLECRLMYRR